MRSEWSMTREGSIRSAVLGIAILTSGVAVGLIVISLFDIETLRDFFDQMAPDGEMRYLDPLSNVQIRASLRELTIVTTATAVMLLMFRQRLVSFLAKPSTTTTKVGCSRIIPAELVVASVVFVTWAVLATSHLHLPLRFDETKTFLRAADRSFWILWTHYSTNSHMLHSFLLRIAYLVGDWNLTTLRMPAFLAACFALSALWSFVRQEHGWLAAALASALFATSPFFIEYATNARGYSLVTLFFLLSLLCGRRLVRRPDTNGLWMFQALVISLGFLTHFVMVFPVTITATWMLILRYREGGNAALRPFAGKMALWCCITLAITLLLYTPALMESGFHSLFNNPYVQTKPYGTEVWRYWSIGYLMVSWTKWHMATPLWAQAALLVMIAIGAATPRRPTGHRGTFVVAVVIGTCAVLLVKPGVLMPRATIYLLLASMIVVGTGAAFLIETVLGRLRGNVVMLDVARAVIVWLVLGGFAWWVTRPGVMERFAVETGFSPMAKALTSSILHDLQPGDFVIAGNRTIPQVLFYLRAAGFNPLRIADDSILSINKKTKTYQIKGTRSNTSGRGFLYVDQAAYNAVFNHRRPRPIGILDDRTACNHLEENGYNYQVVTDLPGGKIYQFIIPTPHLLPAEAPLEYLKQSKVISE